MSSSGPFVFMDPEISLMLCLIFYRIRVTASPLVFSADLCLILPAVMHNSLFKKFLNKTVAVPELNPTCATVLKP